MPYMYTFTKIIFLLNAASITLTDFPALVHFISDGTLINCVYQFTTVEYTPSISPNEVLHAYFHTPRGDVVAAVNPPTILIEKISPGSIIGGTSFPRGGVDITSNIPFRLSGVPGAHTSFQLRLPS